MEKMEIAMPGRKAPKPLRVGFVPLCDCAPLLMARELGIFGRFDLRVELTREVGWATVRDKIIFGELDAAHALAPMLFSAKFGLGSIQCDCVTGLVLSFEGNAITLSPSLREPCAGGGDSLRRFVEKRGAPLVLGIPFLYSSHFFLLRAWMRMRGLKPQRDVQLVVAPPPQMPSHLKAGHLDGYCVGEPWNSVAVATGFGWLAATSAEIAPWHPEKVLMAREDFAESRADEHERLIAALVVACGFCSARENRGQVIETLCARECLNTKPSAIDESFSFGDPTGAFAVEAHEPSPDKAAWVLDNLAECGLMPEVANNPYADADKVFRADIFLKSNQLCIHDEITSPVH
jgi:ABC-type nitrate/sulfonate/bicarbonate transport system substrate-binding protein